MGTTRVKLIGHCPFRTEAQRGVRWSFGCYLHINGERGYGKRECFE